MTMITTKTAIFCFAAQRLGNGGKQILQVVRPNHFIRYIHIWAFRLGRKLTTGLILHHSIIIMLGWSKGRNGRLMITLMIYLLYAFRYFVVTIDDTKIPVVFKLDILSRSVMQTVVTTCQ